MTSRRAVKRALVLALVFAVNAGCLMTSTPEFTTEQHTAPFLVEATAIPSPGQIQRIDYASNPTEEIFTADVVSQDDPTGDFAVVIPRLFIDLNSQPAGQPPWFGEPFPGEPLTEPGTLDQTSTRRVSVNWPIGATSGNAPALGCHTATLVVAHQYDTYSECPCQGDYSQITWQLLVCDSATSGGGCEDVNFAACSEPFQQSSMPTNDCAIYQKSLDAGTTCPSAQ